MTKRCLECGEIIKPEETNLPCPKCNSMNREVGISDSGHFSEKLKTKARDINGQKLFEITDKDKISKKGRKAKEFLKVDHSDPKVTTKKHIVKEKNDNGNWEIVHEHTEINPAKHRRKK